MKFNKYCQEIEIEKQKKIDAALLIIYFLLKEKEKEDVSVEEINEYFDLANLSKYNVTYLKRDLSKSSKSLKGKNKSSYKLSRKALTEFDSLLRGGFDESHEIDFTELANINQTPLLSEDDVENSKRMAELYIIIHCYENSVRAFINNTLSNAIGTNWWDTVANSAQKRKLSDRKGKEERQKWVSPRGDVSPLYYLDWGDLRSIMKKQEADFESIIPDQKFIELRFGELERVRNIIAHNGVLPSQDDFNRVVLSFRDWCKQVK